MIHDFKFIDAGFWNRVAGTQESTVRFNYSFVTNPYSAQLKPVSCQCDQSSAEPRTKG